MYIHPVHLIIFLSVLAAGALLKAALTSRRHRRDREALASGDATRFQGEVQALKKRLAVLEQITVEKENSLLREIDLLRH